MTEHEPAHAPPSAVAVHGTVRLAEAARVEAQAADYGAYSSLNLAGTEAAQILLPYDESRGQAMITVSAPLSVAGAGADTTSATFAATGNGTATIPVGDRLTGFTITSAAGASAGTGTVTVTGAKGGTLTFTYQSPAAAPVPPLDIRFPSPLVPAVAGVAIAVTFTGSASTGAGQITAYSAPAASVTGVFVGTEAQCKATAPLGAFVPAGIVWPVRAKQALWIIGNGSPATVTLGAERWDYPQ